MDELQLAKRFDAEGCGEMPLRLISRLTVEGERPSNLAIDRAD
jgi:hypothetical protein